MESQIGEVFIYSSNDTSTEIEVRFENQNVWLNRHQLASLFGRDVKTIGKHISNALSEELAEMSTVAKFATVQIEGSREVSREIEHYNLDMVLSVGYRVKSNEGIRFRRWANEVLHRYLLDGVASNERRLQEVGAIVQVLLRAEDPMISGLANVIADYLPGLELLREFDEGQIDTLVYGTVPGWQLTIDEARSIISEVATKFPQDALFGRERSEQLEGAIAAVYQGFGDYDAYPTVEAKAAHLLYFVVKDHPLVDGNKRSAAALFVTFLQRNNALNGADGSKKVSNNTLAAITLLVATSDPREKELMISLIVRMLAPGATS